MAKKKEVKTNNLTKTEWTQRFTLVGEAKIGDFTYKIDAKSEKSDWVYNSINLGVDCGEKHGTVYCELMGGYGAERDNIIYVHGKNADGSDDFKNQYTIDFEDRFDEDIIADIGDMCFTTVGLERTDKKDIFYTKFLTPYDTIAYIHDNLENGMVITVSGNLRYTLYNGTVQCRKEINYVSLALDKKTKEVVTPDKYRATFTQTMLMDKDSCTKSSLDKDKSALIVDAYILEKFKEYNGHDLTDNGKIKGGQFVPLRRTFEFPVDLTTEAGKKKVQMVLSSDKMFKVKKGVAQITFEGEFVETGASVQTTVDDLPDDIKELIELGLYTEEEALAKCSGNGSRERRMLILKPVIRMVGEEGDKKPVIQRTDEKFTDDDLLLDCLIPAEEEDEEELPFDKDEDSSDDDSDWLNAL
jgi:hypothetical protein